MQQEQNALQGLDILDELKSKCRVCLVKHNESVNIFSSDTKCGKIWEALMECGSVHVESVDPLPSIICFDCLESLRKAYEFRSLCRLSDQTLRQYLNFVSSQSLKTGNNINTPQISSPNIIITNANCIEEPQIVIITDPNITSSTLNQASLDSNATPIQISAITVNPVQIQTVNSANIDILNSAQPQQPPLVEIQEVKKPKRKPPISKRAPTKVDKLCCRICFKRYDTDRQLIRHQTISHGERRFQCEICNRKFAEKSVLKSHMMAIHTGNRPYKCQFCDKSYIAKNHLRIHLLAHTGARPYACDICDKTFAQKNVLHHHKSLHSGLKPYSCTLCQKKFLRLSILTRHIETVHQNKSENIFNVADKKEQNDTKKKSLSTKLRPYECLECNKRFYRKEHLDRHTSSHTGERPFKCDVCHKGFIRKWDVKRHMIVHKKSPTVIVPQVVVDAMMKQINAS